jgi:predicted nucleic acid-binding protein
VTILTERLLFDTNVWIFGLRRDEQFSACAELLDHLGWFFIVIPRQVMKELNANLAADEMRDFYRLINRHSDRIEVNWQPVSSERVRFYEQCGCKKGDAVIAAHAEAVSVKFLVTENRQFLQAIKNLPFEIITPAETLARLKS